RGSLGERVSKKRILEPRDLQRESGPRSRAALSKARGNSGFTGTGDTGRRARHASRSRPQSPQGCTRSSSNTPISRATRPLEISLVVRETGSWREASGREEKQRSFH